MTHPPDQYRLPGFIDQTEYLVDGQIKIWDGLQQDVHSVISRMDNGQWVQDAIGRYPLLDKEKSLEALTAAGKAYDNGRGQWPVMPIAARIQHMEDFVFRIRDKKNDIVKLLIWEIGKSLNDATKEFDRTIEYIRDTIHALKDLDRISSRFVIEQGIFAQIRRAPLGIVLCMGPYNYPLNETFTTLIPALLMGNTIIFKPPRIGVLLHRPLLEAFRDSFPPGVVNTVYGKGQDIITPLMESGKIDVLAFIGSSQVGDAIKKLHPKPHRLRSVLGLEAKNAGIIIKDADLLSTAKECVLGSLSFNGQRCTALKNIFVEQVIADRFVSLFVEEVDRLTIGFPWQENVQITPLPELAKIKYLDGLVDDALSKGARIVNKNGGVSSGTIYHPAVLYPVQDTMRVFHEEQFGPVVPITPFESIDMPVGYIENSNYGQQVSVFGTDPEVISHLIDPLVNQVCRVNINSQCQRGPDSFPFTGRKDSAEGTLSVTDALRVFSIRTLVAAKENDLNKTLITKILHERKSGFLSTDFIL